MSRALDVVFSLINYGRPDTLNPSDFVIGLPEYFNSEVNTRISIKPKLSTAKYGSFWFHYNRIRIEDLEDLEAVKQSEISVSELFPKLNLQTPYYLSMRTYNNSEAISVSGLLYEEEFIDKSIPAFGAADHVNVILKAIPNSYLFTGQTLVKIRKNI